MCCEENCCKRTTIGSSSNRKEMIKEGNEASQMKKEQQKIGVNLTDYSLEFKELCLIVEAKIITLCDAVLNIYRKKILENYKGDRIKEPKWTRSLCTSI